jgi:2-keto-4-pentenoate hydratase
MTDINDATATTDLATLLANAMRDGQTIGTDGLAAPDVAGAYAIQADILNRLGVDVPEGYKFSLRDGGLYGAPLIFVRTDPAAPFCTGIKVEIELALTLASDLPPRAEPYTRQDVVDAIASVAIGVELVRSRYAQGPGSSLPLLLSDMMSNAGYIVGPALDRALLADGADLGTLLLTNGDTVLFDGAVKHPDGDPLAAVVSAANGGLPMGGFLKKGHVVTTGTLCGAPLIPAASAFTARLGGEELTVQLTA